jgi:ECF transporter S component (folate family)
VNKTKTLVFVSLLIAMEVIFTRFLSFQTPIVRIGFGFIPIAFAGILFGPIVGGLAGAAADIIGMMLFPVGGNYFPGFTLSAFLNGAIYGVFLHDKPVGFLNIAKSVVFIVLFIDIGLNTLWLSILMKKAVAALIIPRLIKNIAMLPIQIITIQIIWKYIGSHINSAIYAKQH